MGVVEGSTVAHAGKCGLGWVGLSCVRGGGLGCVALRAW